MPLSHWTIEALEHKADIADDEASNAIADGDDAVHSEWQQTSVACRQAIEEQSLAGNALAIEELINYADPMEGDPDCRAELRAIRTDLCRAGAYEQHDPSAIVCGRNRRPMKVDGVLYDV